MNSNYQQFEDSFLWDAKAWIRNRYETMTGLDSHGGQFNKKLYIQGYTFIGELDHEISMAVKIIEFRRAA